jgi:predicted aldo/keto reductase-like oxidoreductase
MEYRRFGRTELRMPVLSCGGMRYQQAWKDVDWPEIEAAGQANLEATIRRALAVGINHIETARGYGSSERQLGRILPTLPRDEMIIQTKVSPNADPAVFRRDFETSMERLQLDHVDLLGLHGINNREVMDWAMRPGGCLDVAYELKKAGRVKHIGFSTHAWTDVIVDTIESGRFDYVNLHWYWADQVNAPAIDAAKRHDMGLFIISPSDKGGKLYEPPDKLVELCKPFTPMGFNDLFCLWRADVHTLSIGAARPTDFDAHLAILPFLGKQAEVLPPILSRLEAAMVEALGADWQAHWYRDLPETDSVPGTVNIYHVLRLYTLTKAYDMEVFGKMRYNLFGNGGHWFYGNKVDNGLMRRREASINDVEIDAAERRFVGADWQTAELPLR